MENKVDQIYSGSTSIQEFAKKYTSYLSDLLGRLDHKKIQTIAEKFIQARNEGKKLLFIGNGGSAATASHWANDLSIGTRSAHRPFRALSLTDNSAILTCIGNDFGYDHIFTKQLENVMEPGDLVIAISASGNSPNLLRAIEYASSKGNSSIGFLGFDGGKLKELCTVSLVVETAKGEYGPVEDIHMVMDHLISSYLIRMVRRENNRLTTSA